MRVIVCLWLCHVFCLCFQMAQPLIAGVLWEDIMKNFPEALGDENPNNQKIEKLFGNQGGH